MPGCLKGTAPFAAGRAVIVDSGSVWMRVGCFICMPGGLLLGTRSFAAGRGLRTCVDPRAGYFICMPGRLSGTAPFVAGRVVAIGPGPAWMCGWAVLTVYLAGYWKLDPFYFDGVDNRSVGCGGAEVFQAGQGP